MLAKNGMPDHPHIEEHEDLLKEFEIDYDERFVFNRLTISCLTALCENSLFVFYQYCVPKRDEDRVGCSIECWCHNKNTLLFNFTVITLNLKFIYENNRVSA